MNGRFHVEQKIDYLVDGVPRVAVTMDKAEYDRVIDSTRQGISHEPDPDRMEKMHPPVPLKEAMAVIAAWAPGYAIFKGHAIARALYEEVLRLQGVLDAATRGWRADREEDAARMGTLRRENEELRRKFEARTKELVACQGQLIDRNCELGEARAQRQQDISALVDKHDKLWLDYQKMEYQARMLGHAFPDTPPEHGSNPEHYGLERALTLMDSWRDDVEKWGLHQMCRTLREAYEEADGSRAQAEGERDYAKQSVSAWADEANRWTEERNAALDDLADLQRTFDLRWDADQRAIKYWRHDHPGNDRVWPDHADMVVWLLGKLDVSDEAREVIHSFQTAHERALAAIPCARVKDECSGQDYPWAPCCNLRVAMLPGESFPTDHLPDEGFIHLFEPIDPEYPGAPRKSAGCVKLFEPTPLGWLDAMSEGGDIPESIRQAGNHSAERCEGCGGPIEQIAGKGRPRRYCLTCRPRRMWAK